MNLRRSSTLTSFVLMLPDLPRGVHSEGRQSAKKLTEEGIDHERNQWCRAS